MQNIKELQAYLRDFAEKRDWDQFHSPKNLAMALSAEVGELVECFQWLTEKQSEELPEDKLAEVADEIADVQIYLARLADKLGVDVDKAIEVKILKNEKKYPSEQVRGSAKKYSEYSDHKDVDE